MVARRILVTVLILLNLFFLYKFFFSGHGLFAYLDLKAKNQAVDLELDEARGQVVALSREIRLLAGDRDYQGRVVREQMHYLRPGEILYVFSDAAGRAVVEERPDAEQD